MYISKKLKEIMERTKKWNCSYQTERPNKHYLKSNPGIMKAIILFFVLVHASLCLSGQYVKFGVYAEPQLAWLSPDTRGVSNDGLKIGIHGGLSIDKYFQKNYALHSGIAIGTQGGKLRFDSESYFTSYNTVDTLPAGTTVTYNLNYITVPVGLKLKTNQIGYFSYYACTGFTNQFNIKAKATSSEGTLSNNVLDKEIFFFNMAYHFGIGIEYNISEDTAVDIGISYHNGFIDFSKDKYYKAFLRNVALRIGVIF